MLIIVECGGKDLFFLTLCAMGSKHFCFVERGAQNVLLLLFRMNLATPPPPPSQHE